jgi:hypothetical protein
MDSKDFRKKYKICASNSLPIAYTPLAIVDLVGEKCFDMIKIDDEFCFVGYDTVHPNCYYNDEWFMSYFFIN